MTEERHLYLPFKCPSCGVDLKIKADRLNQQYGCKNCEKKFYINRTGDIVIGTRPAGSSSDKHGIQIDPTGGIPTSKAKKKKPLVNITPKAQMGIAVAGVALLIFGTIQFLPASGGADLPTTLKGRAQYVCDAIVQKDADSLKKITSSSTRGSIRELIAGVRKSVRMRPMELSAKVTTKVLFQNEATGKAGSLGTIEVASIAAPTDDSTAKKSAEPASAAKSKADDNDSRTMQFMMHWTLGSDKQWILDAEETVKEMGGN